MLSNNESASELIIQDLTFLLTQIKQDHIFAKPKDIIFLEKIIKYFTFSPLPSLKYFLSDSIPDIFKRIRPIFWRLLFDYLPLDPSKWLETEISTKELYEKDINNFIIIKKNFKNDENNKKTNAILFQNCNDHPLSRSKASSWNTFFSDQNLWEEIEKDIKRTRKDIAFFSLQLDKIDYKRFPKKKENEIITHYDILTRILFIYGKKNPDFGYFQGMNELLAPIYYCFVDNRTVFNEFSESDAFFCFSKLMEKLKQIFLKQKYSEKLGLYTRIKNFDEFFKKKDKKLYEILKNKGVNSELYVGKWILVLFSQEFNLDDLMKLWDVILNTEDMVEFLNYISLAILILLREELINGDFSTIMILLQNSKKLDIKSIIEKANNLYKEY